MEKISLAKVIKTMNYVDKNGEPSVFDLSVVTLNRYSKKGGVTKHYKNASVSLLKKKQKQTIAEQRESLKHLPKQKRSPNHKVNRTINIDVPDISHPVTIHYRLIKSFNGKKVHY